MLIIKGLELLALLLVGILVVRVRALFLLDQREESMSGSRPELRDEASSQTDDNPAIVPNEMRSLDEIDDEILRRTKAFKSALREASDDEFRERRTERKVLLKKSPLQEAEAFFDSQLAEVAHDTDQLDHATNSFLIGAIDFIGRQRELDDAARRKLISETFHSKLPGGVGDQPEAMKNAVALAYGDQIHLARAGAKAARMWLKKQSHSEELSLKTQLGAWRAFA